MIVPLSDVKHAAEFGGKALELGRAKRAGLPVPPGFALSFELVHRLAAGQGAEESELVSRFKALGSRVAVRSSAVGEDSATASFAGQHATVLNVRTAEALLHAVAHVHRSARTEAALAYRRRLGLPSEPRMGVVIQSLVKADCSGILFTKNPTTGADERVIEAAWGLGESVVAGLVTPDRYRMARGGQVLEQTVGEKDLAVVWNEQGGTAEIQVEPQRIGELCLDARRLTALEGLTARCEAEFGGTQDLEWSFMGEELFLLQRRAITRG